MMWRDLFEAAVIILILLFGGAFIADITGWSSIDGAVLFVAGGVWSEMRTMRGLRELARQIAKEPRS